MSDKRTTAPVPKAAVSANIPFALAEEMWAAADRLRITYSEAQRLAIAAWVERQRLAPA